MIKLSTLRSRNNYTGQTISKEERFCNKFNQVLPSHEKIPSCTINNYRLLCNRSNLPIRHAIVLWNPSFLSMVTYPDQEQWIKGKKKRESGPPPPNMTKGIDLNPHSPSPYT